MEQKALYTLHYVCDFPLNNWICADKPDLQTITDCYGIEVVQDVYPKEQEMTRFVETIWQKPYTQIDSQKMKRFENAGGSVTLKNGIIHSASFSSTDNNPNHLISTIVNKINLINNGNYKTFKRYGLYVFVNTVFIGENFNSCIHHIIDEIATYQESCSKKYDTLFFDQNYTICNCDLIKKTFHRKAITKEIREHIHQKLENLHLN